jgi:hypothetical protein
MTKTQELQRWIGEYRRTTGIKEVDHHDLAKWLKRKGWPMPKPKDEIDLLAKQISDAARLQTRQDTVTGDEYRAYHSYTVPSGNGQLTLWIDIDEATRPQMWKSTVNKREQVVGELWRMAIDTEHWSRINPDQEPIQVPLDFTYDIEWRKNAPNEGEKAS